MPNMQTAATSPYCEYELIAANAGRVPRLSNSHKRRARLSKGLISHPMLFLQGGLNPGPFVLELGALSVPMAAFCGLQDPLSST